MPMVVVLEEAGGLAELAAVAAVAVRGYLALAVTHLGQQPELLEPTTAVQAELVLPTRQTRQAFKVAVAVVDPEELHQQGLVARQHHLAQAAAAEAAVKIPYQTILAAVLAAHPVMF